MEMLPQPPPGVSPRPPDQTARRSWVWLSLIVIGGLGAFLVLFLMFGVKLHHGKRHEIFQVTSNALQIGLALYEFEQEYGSCPNPSTVKAVKEETGTTWRLGDRTANGLLKQLIVTKTVMTEEVFSYKGSGKKRPDNVFAAESQALAKGECGFAYIVCDAPTAPRLVAPLIPGTTRFDPKPFDGKAIVLFGDGKVAHMMINRAGDVIYLGKLLFDPSNPRWAGKPFEVFHPE